MLSKYEKSSKLIEKVKVYQLLKLSHADMLDALEVQTGTKFTDKELQNLITKANEEVKLEEIEVNEHLEYLVRIGFFVDLVKQRDTLDILHSTLLGLLFKEMNKKNKASIPNIVNLNNSLLKVFAEQRNMTTSMAFLAKARAILENRGEEGVHENKNFATMVEKKKDTTKELIEKAIDIHDFDANKVA